MQPKVLTISIPTWNREKLLAGLLEQLIGQVEKYKLGNEVELLISNNGSEDNTHQIVENYITKYPYLTYNRNPFNIGGNPNVMKSMELASSEFLMVLGDDDRINEGSLTRVIEFLKSNPGTGLVVDSNKFKRKNSEVILEQELTLAELLRKYYWNMGNAGVFIIRSSYVKEGLEKYGAGFFNQCWSQTQFIILGLSEHNKDKIFIKDLNIISHSVHQDVTIYNSFYLWRAGYLELFMALKSMDKILGKVNLQPAYDYLKENVFQFALFNILQFGVFIDGEDLRDKTKKHVLKNAKHFSFFEKVILYLIVIGLLIPQPMAVWLGNLFILITKGKAGIVKKDQFVEMELEKRRKAEKLKSISVRKLEFETDNY